MADDGVEIVGVRGSNPLRDWPHARCHCLEKPLTGAAEDKEVCDNCRCFLCESTPAECPQWGEHCHATDTEPKWIAQKKKMARRKEAAAQAAMSASFRRPIPTHAMPMPAHAAYAVPYPGAIPGYPGAVPGMAPQPVPPPAAPPGSSGGGAQTDELDEADEDAEEVFAQYAPQHVSTGSPHPDPVCETTSLSYVTPPLPTYAPAFQPRAGQLSDLQVETLVYANQRFETRGPDGCRAGFFLGDGVGLGKGRQLAAIIHENMLRGRRRHLWLSVSADLIVDARRDLADIGVADVPLHALNKLPYGRLDSKAVGVKEGIIFVTYASLVASSGSQSRLKQLVAWMRGGNGGGDGCVCFDESHKAKNLVAEETSSSAKPKSSKTALCVQELQSELPDARVVYCSATGASSLRAMAYMSRLGLWGPGTSFVRFADFLKAIERGGTGALELVALDMKQRGMYISRQLSFHTASFQTLMVDLDERERRMYDGACEFWAELHHAWTHAVEMLGDGGGSGRGGGRGGGMTQFWGAHQRFFKQLVMSVKVRAVVAEAKAALAAGKCVVIGLQGTGEARVADAVEAKEDLDDFCAARAVVAKLVAAFPTSAPGSASADAEEDELLSMLNGASADADEGEDEPAQPSRLRRTAAQHVRNMRRQRRRRSYAEDSDSATPDEEEEEEGAARPAAARRASHAADDDASRPRASDTALVAALRPLPPRRLRALVESVGMSSRNMLEKMQMIHALARREEDVAHAASGAARAGSESEAEGEGGAEHDAGVACAKCAGVLECELMLCDGPGCERAAHSFCCEPPLERVPEGDWFCSECAPMHARGGAGGSALSPARVARGRIVVDDEAEVEAEAEGGSGSAGGAPQLMTARARSGRQRRRVADSSEDEAYEEEDGAGEDEDDSDPEWGAKRPKRAAKKRAAAGASGGKRARDRTPSARNVDDASSAEGSPAEPQLSRAPSAAHSGGARGPHASRGPSPLPAGALPLPPPPAPFASLAPSLPPPSLPAAAPPAADAGAPPDPQAALQAAKHARGVKSAFGLKRWLEDRVGLLALPTLGPLDELIDALGGTSQVAEMTGRKGQLVRAEDGTVQYARRNAGTGVSMEALNLSERQAFMDGEKRVAVISEAASSGISLQADKRAKSGHMPRVHITLELPWSSEQAIQQCGRTHRSNQRTGPHYLLVMSNIAGERRFASAVAKRLASLGALTKGDRRANDAGDLSAFDLDNKWGAEGLEQLLRTVFLSPAWSGLPEPPAHVARELGIEQQDGAGWLAYLEEAEELLASVGVSYDSRKKVMPVKTFLNRLLGLPVGYQNKLFTHFAAEVEEKVKLAKQNDEYGDAVVDIRGASVQQAAPPLSIHEDAKSGAKTTHVQIKTDRGISFADACTMLDKAIADNGGVKHRGDGFYKSINRAIGMQEHHFVLALHRQMTASEAAWMKPSHQLFKVYRPSTGPARAANLGEIREVYRELERDAAEQGWSRQYTRALTDCMHGPNCRNRQLCTVGKRERVVHLVSGSLLPVWGVLERVIGAGRHSRRCVLKVTRVRMDDGTRIIGIVVPSGETVQRIVAEIAKVEAGAAAPGPSAGLPPHGGAARPDVKPDIKPKVGASSGKKRGRPSAASYHARPSMAAAPLAPRPTPRPAYVPAVPVVVDLT